MHRPEAGDGFEPELPAAGQRGLLGRELPSGGLPALADEVEQAAQFVDAKLLCLDEPTAGVAQREAEAFGPLITSLRRELDASVLIVEHDMPMIMAISDRVYCLEAGAVIAEGPPADIRSNPRVIASYLGTDERAIARSDA